MEIITDKEKQIECKIQADELINAMAFDFLFTFCTRMRGRTNSDQTSKTKMLSLVLSGFDRISKTHR